MKTISWDVAFRKLNEWRKRRSLVTFGEVRAIELQDAIKHMFEGDSSRIMDVDKSFRTVTLEGVGEVNLFGATFKFSDFDDSPLNESELRPEEFESYLEATFPDDRRLFFAVEWNLDRLP